MAGPGKPGRPPAPLLNAETIRKIVARIRIGCHRETAAASIGVARQTLVAWTRRGAAAAAQAAITGLPVPKADEPYVRLVNELDHTEATYESTILAAVTKAMLKGLRSGDPRAIREAMGVLERKSPSRWLPGHQSFKGEAQAVGERPEIIIRHAPRAEPEPPADVGDRDTATGRDGDQTVGTGSR